MKELRIAVEVGRNRTFASALDWPGWCRAGPNEGGSLEQLLIYGPRYAKILDGRVRGFTPPRSVATFVIEERLPGDATTDFGAPGVPAVADAHALTTTELTRLVAIVQACWDGFASAADAAEGEALRPGARGGGRDLEKIRAHAADADGAYLTTLGGRAPRDADIAEVHRVFIEALGARSRGELPDTGPRGGKRWSARYAARRTAWHALDHAWEIEDRTGS